MDKVNAVEKTARRLELKKKEIREFEANLLKREKRIR